MHDMGMVMIPTGVESHDYLAATLARWDAHADNEEPYIDDTDWEEALSDAHEYLAEEDIDDDMSPGDDPTDEELLQWYDRRRHADKGEPYREDLGWKSDGDKGYEHWSVQNKEAQFVSWRDDDRSRWHEYLGDRQGESVADARGWIMDAIRHESFSDLPSIIVTIDQQWIEDGGTNRDERARQWASDLIALLDQAQEGTTVRYVDFRR